MANPNKVMVAQHPAVSPDNHLASNALMSLLREGGQWDDVDDDLIKRNKMGSKTFEGDGSKEWSQSVPEVPHAVGCLFTKKGSG